MKLLIKNAHVIDPKNNVDAVSQVAIANGKIVAINTNNQTINDFTASKEIDATGLTLIPGLVDLSARLREPGYEHKATLTSEMYAAIAGGVTSLVCTPDTDPSLDEPGLVEMLKYRAASLNLAKVYPLGAITTGLKGEHLTEMAELADAGCIGFAHANAPLPNYDVLLRVMQYASSFGYTVWLQPQDPFLSKNGMAHSGQIAAALGLSGIPSIAETISLYAIFELMKITGAKVHLCRLSTQQGVNLVRNAKKEGLPITCDVGIHHLLLTDNHIDYFDSNARLTPPLRSENDRLALTKGLLDGTIDAICSDHTPVDDDEKLLPFGEAEPGATGLELLLSATLTWAKSQKDKNALNLAIGKITASPAAIINKPCGSIEVGARADLCLFASEEENIIETDKIVSQGKHTPFLGQTLFGQVKQTIIDGRIVYTQKGNAS